MKSKYIFGIDLGTVNSSISYLDENLNVRTCANEYRNTLSPSVVDLKYEKPAAGVNAENNRPAHPESVFTLFKKQMNRGHAVIYYGKGSENKTSAVKLSAEMLGYLAKYASEETNSPVNAAVIAVPAYYSPEERKSVKESAELAGISCTELVEEPVAAAVHYGCGSKNESVIVYDLGDAAFDGTVVDIFNGNFCCFAVYGDEHAGGNEWNSLITEMLMEKLSEVGIGKNELDDEDITGIYTVAEKIKKIFFSEDYADVRFRAAGRKIGFSITRKDFERKTKNLLDCTVRITAALKKEAELSGRKISRILLTGSMSRMPQVRKRLMREFPGVKIPPPDKPELAVSKGAARYAGYIPQSPLWGSEHTALVRSVGIRCVEGGKPKIMTLIEKDLPLPLAADIDIPISRDAISSGRFEICPVEHSLREKYVSPDNPDADIKTLRTFRGNIRQGMPYGTKMRLHIEVNKAGLLVLTAADPDNVKLRFETVLDTAECCTD